MPEFETYENHDYFITRLFIREGFCDNESLDSSLDSSDTDQTHKTEIADREKRLIELIEDDPTIIQVEMADRLKWNLPVVKYYVRSLKAKGILERTGTVHNGRWIINK